MDSCRLTGSHPGFRTAVPCTQPHAHIHTPPERSRKRRRQRDSPKRENAARKVRQRQPGTERSGPSPPPPAWGRGEAAGTSPRILQAGRLGERRPRPPAIGPSHRPCRLTSLPRPAEALPGVTFRTEEPLSKALVGANVFLGTKGLILVCRFSTPSRNSSLFSLLSLPLLGEGEPPECP